MQLLQSDALAAQTLKGSRGGDYKNRERLLPPARRAQYMITGTGLKWVSPRLSIAQVQLKQIEFRTRPHTRTITNDVTLSSWHLYRRTRGGQLRATRWRWAHARAG